MENHEKFRRRLTAIETAIEMVVSDFIGWIERCIGWLMVAAFWLFLLFWLLPSAADALGPIGIAVVIGVYIIVKAIDENTKAVREANYRRRD